MSNQQSALSRAAQSVQDALHARGVELKVVELSSSTRTADDAARTIGCEVAQIVKSLVFRAKQTGKPILVLASGVNRVNEKVIAKHVGEKISKADAAFVRAETGFAIGGIPPVGHAKSIETYIDQDLLTHAELWAAAGTPNAVFGLDSAILEELTGGRVISIK
ncbi:YbaK/EbsC family protein [Haliangium sp.]|uniref:YbaK/EbsC family protein n=1 Tax=Haliangium sp. TaxID=2663208 RepID=UPI003D0F113D